MRVTVFAAGTCSAPEALVVRGAPWRRAAFPGGVVLVEHPDTGPVLLDTGFAPRQQAAASRRLASRALLALLHPTYSPTAADRLAGLGIAAADVRHVVLTHAHHDHLGGLLDFPRAAIHATPAALAALSHPPRGHAAAYLPALAPTDLAARLTPIGASAPVPPLLARVGLESVFALLPGMVAVPLPGHAVGQVGVWIEDAETADGRRGPLFVAADAAWRGAHIDPDDGAASLPRWAALAQEDRRAWAVTLVRLRALRRLAPDLPVVLTHDAATWPASAAREG